MADRWGVTFPLESVPLLDHRELLQEAERLGYTDAWTAEVDGTDSLGPLALASAWTEKLRLGSAITGVFTRSPALLAMEAATIAEAAPGRFVLGLGSSSPAIVERWNGVPFERPLRRVREMLRFLRQAFAGEKVTFEGESFRTKGFRLSRVPSQPPPIFVGALRGRMAALAGAEGDGVIANWLAPKDVPKVAAATKEAAKAAGRDPDAVEVAARIFVLAAADEATARGMGKFMITAYLTTPVYAAFQDWLGRGELLRPMQEAWKAGERQQALSLVPDEVVDDLLVIGDRKRVKQRIEEYCDNGVTLPLVAIAPIALDPAERAKVAVKAFRELTAP
ncbi:MAG: LLM class F420-dependent oxidoreductase [Dehalococcoidia bacterium]